MTGSHKGFGFERETSRQLSLWWSQDWQEGAIDSIFWRTAGSGGRMTKRAQRGLKDKFHHGDICAIDPRGQPLLDQYHIELKKGYNEATAIDLLDSNQTTPTYAKWFDKADELVKASGVTTWIIIHKRDRRETTIWSPAIVVGYAKAPARFMVDWKGRQINGMTLTDWLSVTNPIDLGSVS